MAVMLLPPTYIYMLPVAIPYVQYFAFSKPEDSRNKQIPAG